MKIQWASLAVGIPAMKGEGDMTIWSAATALWQGMNTDDRGEARRIQWGSFLLGVLVGTALFVLLSFLASGLYDSLILGCGFWCGVGAGLAAQTIWNGAGLALAAFNTFYSYAYCC